MRYLFLISWLRAREKKLADQVDLDRMIGAPSMDETLRVLNDTDYAPYLSGKTDSDIEEIIEEERGDFQKTLLKMGVEEELLEALFLKEDFRSVAEEIKGEIFQKGDGKNVFEKKKEKDIVKEVKNRNPQNPQEVDDILLDIYFQRVIAFFRKEKKVEKFFKEYQETAKRMKEDLVKRDEVLLKIESEIIEKSGEEIEGFLPILAFFIKKRRAEYFIRSIFAGKRIGMDSEAIYKSLTLKRAL